MKHETVTWRAYLNRDRFVLSSLYSDKNRKFAQNLQR